MKFKEFLQLNEGINDNGIMKAIFIVGIAASGKSTISSPLSFYAKHIDVDAPQEYFSDKYNIDLSKNGNPEDKIKIRKLGKRITSNEIVNYIEGMLPMVVNVVGDDLERTTKRIKILRSFGYDVGMIYINTDLEKSVERAYKRTYGKNKDKNRHVAAEYMYDAYKKLAQNVKVYQDLLFDRVEENKELLDFFIQIRNDGNISNDTITNIHKEIKKFLAAPIKNEKGIEIVDKIKSKNKKLLTDVIDKSKIENKVKDWF